MTRQTNISLILEPLQRYMKEINTAKDPLTKYVYIDLMTDWLYNIAKHTGNPIAFVAFQAILRQVADLKDLLDSGALVDINKIINRIVEYYSRVIDALSRKKGNSINILFNAIEEIAIPLFFELRKYSMMYVKTPSE